MATGQAVEDLLHTYMAGQGAGMGEQGVFIRGVIIGKLTVLKLVRLKVLS